MNSVYPFPLWWLREYTLGLIIIIKSEVWTIIHCLGLGHETMVCAVCLSIFLSNKNMITMQESTIKLCTYIINNQSVYAPSQWETSLHCNNVSHWLGAYLYWSPYHELKCKTYCISIFYGMYCINICILSKNVCIRSQRNVCIKFFSWVSGIFTLSA